MGVPRSEIRTGYKACVFLKTRREKMFDKHNK